jgi:Electron transfer DM13
MKKYISILCLTFIVFACSKAVVEPVVVNQVPPPEVINGKVETKGDFKNGVHAVSGKVSVVTDKTDPKKKYLSFTDFKTDAGPDLYIYLAEDTKATGSISVAKLDKAGTFVLDIPADAKLDKQKYVLIWCKSFTVLFGSALLE